MNLFVGNVTLKVTESLTDLVPGKAINITARVGPTLARVGIGVGMWWVSASYQVETLQILPLAYK